MQLDLNLLAALDALLEEGSVAGAADRLHVTAPAMSRSLGRIRRTTGDQILVRTGRTMTPTPYAIAVREQVHDLLQQVRGVLAPSRELDLATLERTFTLSWHDALVALSGPALLTAVREQAPACGCGSSRSRASTHPSCAAARSTSPRTPTARPHPRSTPTGWPRPSRSSSYGEGIRSPASRPSPPRGTPRRTTSASRRGGLANRLDDALASLDLTRRVVVTAPTESAAFEFARGSDLVVTAPESTARSAAADLGMVQLPLPLDLPPATVYLSWHQRYDTDPAHIWLRDLARSALTGAMSGEGR